jgi:hypothetical protein
MGPDATVGYLMSASATRGTATIALVAGGSARILHGKHVDWEQELTSRRGRLGISERAFHLVWPVLDVRFRPQLLDSSSPTHHHESSAAVDRTKVEWAASSHWQSGVGYAGGICTSRSWQNNPFLTVTRNTRAGKFEVWLQRISGGAQVQLRYFLVREEK